MLVRSQIYFYHSSQEIIICRVGAQANHVDILILIVLEILTKVIDIIKQHSSRIHILMCIENNDIWNQQYAHPIENVPLTFLDQ